MSTSHGVTTVSNDRADERRPVRVGEHAVKSRGRRLRRRELAEHGDVRGASRRERKLVELDVLAAHDPLRHDHQ